MVIICLTQFEMVECFLLNSIKQSFDHWYNVFKSSFDE